MPPAYRESGIALLENLAPRTIVTLLHGASPDMHVLVEHILKIFFRRSFHLSVRDFGYTSHVGGPISNCRIYLHRHVHRFKGLHSRFGKILFALSLVEYLLATTYWAATVVIPMREISTQLELAPSDADLPLLLVYIDIAAGVVSQLLVHTTQVLD